MPYISVRKLGVYFFLFGAVILPKYGFLDFAILFGFFVVSFDLLASKPKVKYRQIYFIIPFLLVLFFSLIVIVIYGDVFGVVRVVRVTFLVFLTAYISQYIKWEQYLKFVFLAILIHLIIIYLEYLDLGGVRLSIEGINGFFYENRDVSYRAKGLFPGYSAAGVFFGVASVFLFYLITESKTKSTLIYASYFLVFMLALLSTVFTSRTGMFISVLGILIILFFRARVLLTVRFLTAASLLTLIVTIGLIFMYPLISDVFDITILRAFEIFYNYSEGKGFTSESTTQLQNTFNFPTQFPDYFIGNGFEPWSREGAVGNSDSGYIQTLNMYGLVGFILYYLPIFFMMIYSLIILLKFRLTIALLVFSLVVIMMAAEIKGHYLYSNVFFIIYGMPFFIMMKSLPTLKNARLHYDL